MEQWELQYRGARLEHEGALRALEAYVSRFNAAMQEFALAQASGDEDRTNRAFTLTQQLAPAVQRMERRVGELGDSLRAARRGLLGALELRLDELLLQRNAARSAEEQRNFAAILSDTNTWYLALQAEEDDPDPTLEPEPDITRNPGDGPADLRRKASLLEHRANQWQADLEEGERRLEELQRAQRTNRTVVDFVAGVGRFGNDRTPVVPTPRTVNPPNPGQPPPGADTLGTEDRPLTLEERIANLEVWRDLVQERIEQIRAKAELFRRWAGGGGR